MDSLGTLINYVFNCSTLTSVQLLEKHACIGIPVHYTVMFRDDYAFYSIHDLVLILFPYFF